MEDNVDRLWLGANEGELHRGASGRGEFDAVSFAGHIGDDCWTSRGDSSFWDCPRFLLH